MNHIDTLLALGPRLLSVENPARYLGGEFGRTVKNGADLRTAMCFPDLYEIGMSNQAVKILYNETNKLEGVSCERVFAVARDFEDLLKSESIPLFTLETGTALSDLDVLGITLGYELCGTGILQILELGGIPLRACDRGEHSPVVVAGGPSSSNPAPWGPFFDFVWIGEAEHDYFSLLAGARDIKRQGGGRAEIVALFDSHESMWRPGKEAKRHIWADFAESEGDYMLPVASVKPVQHHGVVEIMRGCPNGCRFCHAGYSYRPMRARSRASILRDVQRQIEVGGYQEISLTSLSSADYPGIVDLAMELKNLYSERKISFQLPSLKVDAFDLDILDSLSNVRKSGLTFAIETGDDEKRRMLNKGVSLETMDRIITEALDKGWNRIKLYFMMGLPVWDDLEEEAKAILATLRTLANHKRLEINASVSIFVPKPHTPFERSAQAHGPDLDRLLMELKRSVPRNVRLSFHDTFASWLEGIISRGDQRVADLIEAVYREGGRLEAWDEHLERHRWLAAMERLGLDYFEGLCLERPADAVLPWGSVDMRLGKAFMRKETERTKTGEMTPICEEHCTHPCGICGDGVHATSTEKVPSQAAPAPLFPPPPSLDASYTQGRIPEDVRRVLFRFTKEGKAAYYSHLTLMDLLEKALLRSGLRAAYTQGFNPQPKLDFANPLAIGIASMDEIASIDLHGDEHLTDATLLGLNTFLGEGLRVLEARVLTPRPGKKRESLAALYFGSVFEVQGGDDEAMRFLFETYPVSPELAAFRSSRGLSCEGLIEIRSSKPAENKTLTALREKYGSLQAWPFTLKRLHSLCYREGQMSLDYLDAGM